MKFSSEKLPGGPILNESAIQIILLRTKIQQMKYQGPKWEYK